MKLNTFRAAVLAIAPAALLALPAHAETDAAAVVKHYADVAHAKYEDSLTTAKALDAAIDAFLKAPTDETLKAARDAWIKARVPTSRRKSIASAIRSSTTGKARSIHGLSMKA